MEAEPSAYTYSLEPACAGRCALSKILQPIIDAPGRSAAFSELAQKNIAPYPNASEPTSIAHCPRRGCAGVAAIALGAGVIAYGKPQPPPVSI